MAGTVYSATLDGVTTFTLRGDTFNWGSDGYLSNIDEWGGDGPVANTFSLTFAGKFDIGNLHLGGFAFTNIMDSADGQDRNVETLRLSGLGGTVNLTTTHVEVLKTFFVNGQPGATDITFGSAGAGTILLGNGNDTVRGGSGDLEVLELRNGNNTFIGGDGFVGVIRANNGNDTVTLKGGADAISLGSGNDSVTTGNSFVGSITLYSNTADVTSITIGTGNVRSIGLSNAQDSVTLLANAKVDTLNTGANDDTVNLGVNAFIQSLVLGNGNNTLNLADAARVSSVTGYEGDDTVTLHGSSRVFAMKLDQGNNTVTTDTGNVESYYSYGGNNTLNIGSGGVQQIDLTGDGGVHKITAKGFIGQLIVEDHSTTTVILNSGAGTVQLSDGNDKVATGTGYVQLISAGDGNNIITLGAGGAGFVRTGNGDDLIKLNTLTPQYGVIVQAGGGSDTADFSQIAAKLWVDLNRYDYQNVGAVNGNGAPVLGFFSFVQVENLIGGNLADVLQGNEQSNTLSGRNGNDVLRGLAGNDLLAGGAGNDKLSGGAGADVFEFAKGGGRDHITDFSLTEDHIHFVSAHKLSDITFKDQAGGVLLTVGTAQVVVDGFTAAQVHDASHFQF